MKLYKKTVCAFVIYVCLPLKTKEIPQFQQIFFNLIKKLAYRKTGTHDPSGALAGPYKNRKTGTWDLTKNRKTGTWDPTKNRKTKTPMRPSENLKSRTRYRTWALRLEKPVLT